MLFVVDGRQAGIAEGVTIDEFAALIIEHGGYSALNLDGGGSSVLVMQGADGIPIQVSSPTDQDVVGKERPIANHFGIYAQPLGGG